MAEQAINVIYKLAENPDHIAGEILKQVAKIVMTHHEMGTDTSSEKSTENEKDKETEKEIENGDENEKENEGQKEGEKEGDQSDETASRASSQMESSQGMPPNSYVPSFQQHVLL